MVGRLLSFWDGLFSGAMLVLGSVVLFCCLTGDIEVRHYMVDLSQNLRSPINTFLKDSHVDWCFIMFYYYISTGDSSPYLGGYIVSCYYE